MRLTVLPLVSSLQWKDTISFVHLCFLTWIFARSGDFRSRDCLEFEAGMKNRDGQSQEDLTWCDVGLKRMQLLVVRGVRLFSFDRLHCCKYGETWSEEKYIQAGYQKGVWDSQTTEIWEWPWGKRSSSFEVDACSACEMGFVCLGCCGKWQEDLVIKGGSSCPQMCFRML